MTLAKWFLAGLVLLAFSVLIVVGVWGGATALRESSPAYQTQRQLEVEREAWEFAQKQRETYLNEERWGPTINNVARVMPWVAPVGVVIVCILVLGAVVLSSTWVGFRAALGLLNSFQFVAPLVSRRAALDGLTLHLAEKQMDYTGRALVEAERNPGKYLDLSQAPNLRNLSLKSGNTPTRPTTERSALLPPVTIPELLPAPMGVLSLADMGEPLDSYDIPYGKTDAGEKVWSNVIGIHRLLGGSTGSGKTNLSQAMIAMLNRHNSARILANYFIDPKHVAFHFFKTDARTRDYAETPEEIFGLLGRVEAERDRRQKLLKDHGHAEWQPGMILGNEQLPLLAVWADELGTTTENPDAHRLLLDIVRQGRSAGITFTGISQLTDTETAREGIRINCAERACGYVPSFHGSVPIIGHAGAEKVPNKPGYFTVKMGNELTVVRAPHAGYLPLEGSTRPTVIPSVSRPTPPTEPLLSPAGPVEPTDKEQVIAYLETCPDGTMKTPLYRVFHGKIEQTRLDAILSELETEGIAEVYKEPTKGAPRIMTRLVKFFTKEV